MTALPLFHGELVRLAALNGEMDAETLAFWSRDTEFERLLDADPVLPSTRAKERTRIERDENSPDTLSFGLRTLTEDRLIGFVGLFGIEWHAGVAFVGIGIGETDYRGKGYGTDAMRLILRYAFEALHLRRVSLDVFEYNQRAYRSYIKAGFVEEGRARQYLHRDGRRWDLIYMGILREEWLAGRN
jgi:RimJ/RimL family protein N-acetyltransferase